MFTERTNNWPLVGPSAVEEVFDIPIQDLDIMNIVKPTTRAKLTTAARTKPNPPRTRSQVDSTRRRSRAATVRKTSVQVLRVG